MCCCFTCGIGNIICRFLRLLCLAITIFGVLSIIYLVSGILGLIIATENNDIAEGLETFSSNVLSNDQGFNATKMLMKIVFRNQQDYDSWLNMAKEISDTDTNISVSKTKFSELLANSNVTSFRFWINLLFNSNNLQVTKSRKMSLFTFVLAVMPKRIQTVYTISGLLGVSFVIGIFLVYCFCCSCCTCCKYFNKCNKEKKYQIINQNKETKSETTTEMKNMKI